MRGFLPDYQLQSPRSLADALAMLARDPGKWRPFAGGTDLMVLLDSGKLPHRRFIDVWRLTDLRGIHVTETAVTIAALTTYTDVLRSPVMRQEFPLMCSAALQTGGVATQNRGTIGGNIANASPAADTPPSLLVYDAQIELISERGSRRVAYETFHRGYKKMDLADDELIRAIHLPRGRTGWRQTYRKVGTRRAQAISKVCLAAAADIQDGVVREVRIALGSVAPTVVRGWRAEKGLRGHPLDADRIASACRALRGDIEPIDDMRSTARYRTRVATNLLQEFLMGLFRRP